MKSSNIGDIVGCDFAYDNFLRQENYFSEEVLKIINKNGILQKTYVNVKEQRIEFREKEKEIFQAINIALYPKKNPELDIKVRGNRYFNSGTYFIDN